jgi:hypothetical protein
MIAMRKSDPVEETFRRLSAIKANPESAGVLNELRACIAGKSNLVAAKAARIAGECQIAELVPDLHRAFDRFMANPHKLDKGCIALTAIAGALQSMDYWGHEVYLKGIHHVQIEPAYPVPVDRAPELRALCALGLVQSRYPDALVDVVTLLLDPETIARIGAVRAVAATAGDTAPLLLRLKVLSGDQSAEVLGECFGALLKMSPERSVPFVASYLDAQELSVSEEAILALGESRHPAAFEVLRRKWEGEIGQTSKKTLLYAIAALRLNAAIDFLVSLLDSENPKTVSKIISAMAMYKNDASVRRSVERAVANRAETPLTEHYEREFKVEKASELTNGA